MTALLACRWQPARLVKRAVPPANRFLHHQVDTLTLAELLGATNLRKRTPEEYKVLREIYTSFERYNSVGNDIQLTLKERTANDMIMSEKKREYEKGIMDPTQFAPGYHIFEVLDKLQESPLFHMLQKMPKGGALKVIDTSITSLDWVIQLTYRENLWVCTTDNCCHIQEFRFSKEKPKESACKGGEWQTMDQLREFRGEENLKKYLLTRLSMYPLTSFTTNAHAWKHLMGIFDLLQGLLRCADVWGDYFYRALTEFYEDGVQYLEIRSPVPRLYCLDGSRLPTRVTVEIYRDRLHEFKEENPGFIGCKLIYANLRHVEPEVVAKYVKECTELNVSCYN